MSLWVRILLLLGFAAVLLAVTALLVTDARLATALACDKASGLCDFTQEQLTTTWQERLPVASIDRAEVRTVRGRGGSPQVWLVTRGGDYFFADYTFRPSAESVAQQINDFLRNPSPNASLDVTDDGRTMYWLAWALVPICVALIVVLGVVLLRKNPAPSGVERPAAPRAEEA